MVSPCVINSPLFESSIEIAYLRSYTSSLSLRAQQNVLRVPTGSLGPRPSCVLSIVRENYDLGSVSDFTVSLAIVPLLCTMAGSFIYVRGLLIKQKAR